MVCWAFEVDWHDERCSEEYYVRGDRYGFRGLCTGWAYSWQRLYDLSPLKYRLVSLSRQQCSVYYCWEEKYALCHTFQRFDLQTTPKMQHKVVKGQKKERLEAVSSTKEVKSIRAKGTRPPRKAQKQREITGISQYKSKTSRWKVDKSQWKHCKMLAVGGKILSLKSGKR